MMKPKLIIAGITVRLISGDLRFSDTKPNVFSFCEKWPASDVNLFFFFLPIRFQTKGIEMTSALHFQLNFFVNLKFVCFVL